MQEKGNARKSQFGKKHTIIIEGVPLEMSLIPQEHRYM